MHKRKFLQFSKNRKCTSLSSLLLCRDGPGGGDFFAASAAGFSWREVRRPGSALRPPPRNPPQHFLCEEILGTPGIPMPRKARHGRAGTPSPSRKGLRDLNAGQRALSEPPGKQLRLCTQQSAPAGVSRLCEAAIPKPALRAGAAPSSTQGAQSSPAVYPEQFAQARKPG